MASKNNTPMKEHYFSGRLAVWQIDPDVKPRRWTVLTLPFRAVREWFFMKAYQDKAEDVKDPSKEGFQRVQNPAQVNNLHACMMGTGETCYTPVCWSGGVFPWHAKNLKIEDDGTVIVKVNAKNLLPLINGGHRESALFKRLEILEAALAKATKDEDKQAIQAKIDMTLSTEVTIQLYLDPDHLHEDFLNLQKGKGVDKNMTRSMEERYGFTKGMDQPLVALYRQVAHSMASDRESFLYGQVKFDSTSQGKVIQYASITTSGQSEYATSLVGGARIAMKAEPVRDAKWLQETYNEVFYAINNYGTKDQDDDRLPALFRQNFMLTPTLLNGGTRGGVALLIGLGNMLAWRKGFRNQAVATEEDMKRLVKAAEYVFNQKHTGQSAADKRNLMRQFAQEYFMDMSPEYAEENTESVGFHEGIPILVLTTLSYSTFGLKDPSKGGRKPATATPPVEAPTPKPGQARVSKKQQAALAS